MSDSMATPDFLLHSFHSIPNFLFLISAHFSLPQLGSLGSRNGVGNERGESKRYLKREEMKKLDEQASKYNILTNTRRKIANRKYVSEKKYGEHKLENKYM